MPYTSRPRSAVGHPATAPSPLRHASTASSNSGSEYPNLYPPSRNSTRSANVSSHYGYNSLRGEYAGQKRDLSEVHSSPISPSKDYFGIHDEHAGHTIKSARQSLRPLPQAPAGLPPEPRPYSPEPFEKRKVNSSHVRSHSVENYSAVSPSHTRSQSSETSSASRHDGSNSPPPKARPYSMAISRSDSMRAPSSQRSRPNANHVHFSSHLEKPELQSFQKSTTGHLRTLSKFADEEDFSIKSPGQEVIGMHGRRRLQRGASMRGKGGVAGYGGRTWMDQQRQYLQAYEYLCHIGEAKEWIEDIMHKSIPPIVQMEEALRDGVTLAEIVQALRPSKTFRIFRHPRLQFRHSDNIAIFFRFLAEVELPDLFRFELVDLYEKKNIPKVIYCIHALSWLLFRQGIVDFRIGNLVGQLQFEDHELEAMQKGLDKAGISMPNFSGMSANFGEPEPEPEPVETEEERIQRELLENEGAIVDLQSQIRGAAVRMQLWESMQEFYQSEDWFLDLQSRIRGDFARQISDYRLGMRRFAVDLQSALRGFLVRTKQTEKSSYWKHREQDIVTLQSLVRARQARANVQHTRSIMQREEHGVRELQAAIRGVLTRTNVTEQYYDVQDRAEEVSLFQAAVRGMLQRRTVRADRTSLRNHESMFTKLQAAARASRARREHASSEDMLKESTTEWTCLQSAARGLTQRHRLEVIRSELISQSKSIKALQAVLRGAQKRRGLQAMRAALASSRSDPTMLQAALRGYVVRQKRLDEHQALQAAVSSISALQGALRGFVVRSHTYDTLYELALQEQETAALQSLARGLLRRNSIGRTLAELEDQEESITELAALMKGMVVRTQFAEKKKHYKENMEKVIKIQSFVRGRQQGEAYKSLTSGKNPPVGTIKNFVHLLNDSDFDFDEEIESERLRKVVVQHVRQNEMAEHYIDQLEVKIALLVKNKITLDEVIKHQRHFGGNAGSLLSSKDISSKDPFDLKALNKSSRKNLEHYQELFFMLQTQPQYLARLFKRLREQGMAEKESKRVELLMNGLFGFAQKRREEYYLLKLISRSLKEEIDGCSSLQDYLRGNYFWTKIFGNYVRSPRDRKFLKDCLGSLVKDNIIENEGLDLESDPMQIYRSAINNEELRTGQRSRRNPDIPREEAIRDKETRDTFIAHLQDLRDIADLFFNALEDCLHKMPFGVRYIAQQTFEILRAKFPYEEQQHLLLIVGQWVWRSYLQPALTAPEQWGVIERGLSPSHKRNLSEVAKVVGQVAAGRLFGGDNVYLQPMNPYVSDALVRLEEIWAQLIDVRTAENQFDIDEFNDLYSRQKPTLYIKLADIFAIHSLINTDLPYICPNQDDALREVMRELGSAKRNESEMMGVGSSEMCLTLTPKLHDVQDPDAAIKSLFMETKRIVLYIIRIQTGPDLLSIMVRPITDEDEDKWDALLAEEIALHDPNSRNRGAYTDSETATTLLDITTLSYTELKRSALENILRLESAGRISRHNHYQDLLNAIAVDIRTKHRRRIQRTREMEGTRATLAALDEKAKWLDQQLKSYNDYIEQAMVTLQNKKGKKRFLMPFTKQYNHERELQRLGRTPKFGSYKYSARTLAEKGVLVSWAGYAERQWDKLNLTVSSDEVGVFCIEGSSGSMMIPGASAMVPLEDLLQAQFENCQFMNLFEEGGQGRGGGGGLRLNVNLFLHLVMKKFYRDE